MLDVCVCVLIIQSRRKDEQARTHTDEHLDHHRAFYYPHSILSSSYLHIYKYEHFCCVQWKFTLCSLHNMFDFITDFLGQIRFFPHIITYLFGIARKNVVRWAIGQTGLIICCCWWWWFFSCLHQLGQKFWNWQNVTKIQLIWKSFLRFLFVQVTFGFFI